MPATCPICHRPAAPQSENPSAPFCSARCRQLDLGRWLNEGYRVPDRPVDAEPDGAAAEKPDPGEDPR